MLKLILTLAFLLCVASASSMQLTRLPSKMQQLSDDGVLHETLLAYEVRKALALAANESQPQTDQYNLYYLGQMQIGTPPQLFKRIIMDTSSSDLWVADSSHTQHGKYTKTKFDSSKSSTYSKVTTNPNWKITYGDGTFAEGFKGKDVVQFTDTDYKVSTVFGQAKKGQKDDPIDGICGLAYESISAMRTTPPWISVVENAVVKPPNPFFTFWLTEIVGDPSGVNKGGAITFGDYDRTHCSATCNWVPLSNELWYEFAFDSITAGPGAQGRPSSTISDSGTSFIIGPNEDVRKIGMGLGATYDSSQGLWMLKSCNPSQNPTTIDVKINGVVYPIPAKHYIVTFDGGKTCAAAIAGGNVGSPAWIFGDPFVRAFCNVFDFKNKRIGLCKSTM